MENQENTEEKVIFIKKKPSRPYRKSLSEFRVSFNFDDNDPYEHVCKLPDDTIVKIDPNADLTWEELLKTIKK